jgi:hypothetical protein
LRVKATIHENATRREVPLLDCVALPVGHRELYITWLDPATHAVVEVLVMNFANRTVCNCVPGSAAPERAR